MGSMGPTACVFHAQCSLGIETGRRFRSSMASGIMLPGLGHLLAARIYI